MYIHQCESYIHAESYISHVPHTAQQIFQEFLKTIFILLFTLGANIITVIIFCQIQDYISSAMSLPGYPNHHDPNLNLIQGSTVTQ